LGLFSFPIDELYHVNRTEDALTEVFYPEVCKVLSIAASL